MALYWSDRWNRVKARTAAQRGTPSLACPPNRKPGEAPPTAANGCINYIGAGPLHVIPLPSLEIAVGSAAVPDASERQPAATNFRWWSAAVVHADDMESRTFERKPPAGLDVAAGAVRA